MLIFSVLPVLFIFAAAVGIFICLAALRGLITGTVFAPNLKNKPPGKMLVKLSGYEGRIWAVIELGAGLCLIVLMLMGMRLYSDFRNSPAYIDSLVSPPAEKQVLYSAVKESGLEAIYVFDIDAAKVRSHYLAELEENGWTISGKPGATMISAEKGNLALRLVIIGTQAADQKDFNCKLIISLDIR